MASEAAAGPARGEPEARRRILLAAETLFLTRGFSRITMDELASGLGMSKKTLYAHFAGKEDLFRAVADRFIDEWQAELSAVSVDERLDYPERVRRFLAVAASRARRLHPPVVSDIQRSAPHLLAYLLEKRRRALHAPFGALIRAGVASGMVRADLHPDLVLRLVLTAIEQVAVPETVIELGVTPAEVFHTISTVLFEGMLTAEARANGPIAPP